MQYAKPVTLNVEECDRLSFLPYLFGNDFLYAEAYVYALAQKMMPEYQGGFWHFIRLPDGGGYMMPDGDRFHMVNGANWFDRNLTCRTAKQSRLSGILPGWSVTGLPYLNGKLRCRRVYCVNHNGCGKRSGRLPGKICCRSDCSRWSGIWFVTCRKRKPWAETDTGR